MKKLVIHGGKELKGDIEIAGAKNSALKLMTASILSDKPLTLKNVPQLSDVSSMIDLLNSLGVESDTSKFGDIYTGVDSTIVLDAANVNNLTAHYDLVRKMRSSFTVIGPLLGRFGEAKVSLPGGCAIGSRPVDLHIFALEKLGVNINIEKGYVYAKSNGRLKGAEILMPKSSVGATETAVLAAVLAEGTTVIKNASAEYMIPDLANCLNAMGAKISGAGTTTVIVEGVDSLNGAEYEIVKDNLEAATYAIASVITNGRIAIKDINIDLISYLIPVFDSVGAKLEQVGNDVLVYKTADRLSPAHIVTDAAPGFPTDMQAQVTALMAVSNGISTVTENVFENRFMHIPELVRMGAKINVGGKIAMIHGVEKLYGAQVMATDLRASASLVLAGLVAEGTTVVNRLYHLERGYERLVSKLQNCGADVEVSYDDAEE